MAKFSESDLEALSALHVQRAFFAHMVLPSATRRVHNGMGPTTIGGYEWEGVSDPYGGQLVGIDSIEEPQFGQASAIDIIISGANLTFLKSMWDDRAASEGVQCDVYFATFDAETGEVLVGLKKIFPGKISAFSFPFIGPSARAVKFKIVSAWEGMNFTKIDSEWSPAGQRRRYSGDKGLDFIAANIVEEFKA